ncbi:MAG: hypothetical protein K2Z81_15455 [Cyanobacteria bacterium]|nr:hypothetical protein [Cyanobacteriota bacterium]
MTKKLRQQMESGLQQLFADEDPQDRKARIETARITQSRLKVLSRIDLNKAVKPSQLKNSTTDMSLALFRNWCKKST